MAKLVLLLLALTAACKSKSVLTPPAAPPPSLLGSADPWSPPTGSALDIPKWAQDPPAVLRAKVNGVNADVVMLKSSQDLTEYRDVVKTFEHTPGVIAAEPFVFVEGDLFAGSGAGSGSGANTALKAIDPARVDRVLTIGKHMVTGSLAALHDGDIALGDDLAKKLGVKLGDPVTLAITIKARPLDDPPPPDEVRTKTFRVAGTFHMDFDQYDDRLALTTLPSGQALVGRGDEVMGVEAIVQDVEHADVTAKAIADALGGPPYEVMDWYELNKQTFDAVTGGRRF